MSEAQTILKMIEEVDPDDGSAMHDINKEVMFYTLMPSNEKLIRRGILDGPYPDNYTRSRDALKSIRPKVLYNIGMITTFTPPEEPQYQFIFYIMKEDHTWIEDEIRGWGATEELAELHAIIQAIEWERTNDQR